MPSRTLTLTLLSPSFAVCRLEPHEAVPNWAFSESFSSITRTSAELSIICNEEKVPPDVKQESGWRCLSVVGQLDFEQIGVFASIAGPLAEAQISIFPIATYDTDHVLVKDADLTRAVEALVEAGHQVYLL